MQAPLFGDLLSIDIIGQFPPFDVLLEVPGLPEPLGFSDALCAWARKHRPDRPRLGPQFARRNRKPAIRAERVGSFEARRLAPTRRRFRKRQSTFPRCGGSSRTTL